MKKLLLVTACALFAACATAPKTAQQPGGDFNNVTGKAWQLSTVKTADGKIIFDMSKQNKEFFKDIFTLQFNDGRAAGKASPNRYTAPLTVNGGKMTFGPAASTMMLGIREPEGLNEHEYFMLLAKVYKWNTAGDNLTLSTVNGQNEKITMTFSKFN